jgi:hypothetical protein
MDYFAGLDVSVKTTSVCIVDDTGKIVAGRKGRKRTRSAAASADEPWLSLQTDWTGSRATVAVANALHPKADIDCTSRQRGCAADLG